MRFFLSFLVIALTGCFHVKQPVYDPPLPISSSWNQSLVSIYPSLDHSTPWGQEIWLGIKFAQDFDYYRAITCFKKARYLMKDSNLNLNNIDYQILLAYWLSKHYDDVLYHFEKSSLKNSDASFVAFSDLLMILQDCFFKTNRPEKAKQIQNLIAQIDSHKAKCISITEALCSNDVAQAKNLLQDDPTTLSLLNQYEKECKSPKKAQVLNAIIPGAGYWYLGQKNTALTAFTMNSLFSAAAWHFFQKGHTAAGLITLSFETGWYFGGIHGVKQSTYLYNQEKLKPFTEKILYEKNAYPVFQLQYGF